MYRHYCGINRLAALATGVLMIATTARVGAQATFQSLGGMPGSGGFGNLATGISADGTVVVGYGNSANGTEAFFWTQSMGMEGIGDLAGGVFHSQALGVSQNGLVVVGRSVGTVQNRSLPFRWTAASGMLALPLLPGDVSGTAYGASSDGSVIVGSNFDGNNAFHAFRWTEDVGPVILGDLTGGSDSAEAFGVSVDGGVVVGHSSSANSGPGRAEAFRWTASSGMQGLGDLPGGAFNSIATAVSADGAVVVGWSYSANSTEEAFRWTVGTGMVSLGRLSEGSFSSVAQAVSGDGSIVVGKSHRNGWEAFIWDAQNGMRSLKEVLEGEYGLDLSGWQLNEATAISPDGRHIAGVGRAPIPFPGATMSWKVTLPPRDSDEDGLNDPDEATHGTNPNDPDTDDDGLLDGTEVDMAQGSGCPDPLDADSDDDGLSDGAEVVMGTSPCDADTDDDGVGDAEDPTPLVPGVPGSWIESALRDAAAAVLSTDLGQFEAPNNNARAGRRNAMSNKLTEAANLVAAGDRWGAIVELQSLLEKLDGDSSPPDWMKPGESKDLLAERIRLMIALLSIP